MRCWIGPRRSCASSAPPVPNTPVELTRRWRERVRLRGRRRRTSPAIPSARPLGSAVSLHSLIQDKRWRRRSASCRIEVATGVDWSRSRPALRQSRAPAPRPTNVRISYGVAAIRREVRKPASRAWMIWEAAQIKTTALRVPGPLCAAVAGVCLRLLTERLQRLKPASM